MVAHPVKAGPKNSEKTVCVYILWSAAVQFAGAGAGVAARQGPAASGKRAKKQQQIFENIAVGGSLLKNWIKFCFLDRVSNF